MNGSSGSNGFHATGGQQQQQQSQQPRVHFGEEVNGHARNGDHHGGGGGGVGGTLHHFMGIVTAILASICVGGLLTILCILYVTIRPFSLSLYRRLSAQIGAASMLDALALLLPNTRIYLSGDSDVPTPVGTSLLVSNHLCNADWWAILMLGRCVGLRGSVKIFMRNEYLHVQTQNCYNSFSDEQAAAAAAASASSTSTTTSGSARNSPVLKSPVSGSAVTLTAATTTTNSGSPSERNGSTTTSTTTPGGAVLTTTTARHYGHVGERAAGHDLSLTAKLLHLFLDFPLINGEDYVTDRENLFRLLRSFAKQDTDNNTTNTNGNSSSQQHAQHQQQQQQQAVPSSTAWGGQPPVHLLLFPEAWSVHYKASHCVNINDSNNSNNSIDSRQAILARSNEFAQKESRPQLKHLLLPRTRGFNASLECLRASSPVVYDVTMAYAGYDGSLPPCLKLSLTTIWDLLRRKFPRQVHIRIKRYSMEEVLQDSSWLDKKWQEKDRLLSHFARHQCFPTDSRGYYGRHRVFDTRRHSMETSIVALLRLLLLPWAVPLLLLLSIPLFWTLFWIWLANNVVRLVLSPFTSHLDRHDESSSSSRGGRHNLWGRRSDHADGRSDGSGMMNGGSHHRRNSNANSDDDDDDDDDYADDEGAQNRTPGGSSAPGTPFVPATPFASPSAKYFSGDARGGPSPS